MLTNLSYVSVLSTLMDQITELPAGYQEAKQAGKEITITKNEAPWMRDEVTRVNLSHITLNGGESFYLGSAITHPALVKEAEKLGKQGPDVQKRANEIFYKQVAAFMRTDYNPDVPMVTDRRTNRKLYYAKNHQGERMYFMEFDKMGKERVIIRIAACSKNGQDNVLKLIATR